MRDDGGPETFDELLVHLRAMAEVHRERGYLDEDVKVQASAFARAYDSAADELIRVMQAQGLLPQESELR